MKKKIKKTTKPKKNKYGKTDKECEDFWRQQLAKAEYEQREFLRERGW